MSSIIRAEHLSETWLLSSTCRADTDQSRLASTRPNRLACKTQPTRQSWAAVQVWCTVLGWYVEQRRYIENEVRKYSDPSSDRLLPDLPAHMRCAMLAY